MTNQLTDRPTVETQALGVIGKPLPLRITSRDEYVMIAEDLRGTSALLKEIDAHHDPIIQSANRTHKLALEAKAKYATPLAARKTAASRLLGNYDAEQRRIAQLEADRKRREFEAQERERREAEERERREAAAALWREESRRRSEAEAARQLAAEAEDDEMRRAFEDAAVVNERAANDAAMLGEYEHQAAEVVASSPIVAPSVSQEVMTPRVENVATRTTWAAEVTDAKKFLAHVLANWERYSSYIEILLPALNRTATNVKKEMEIEPGVMARPKHSASARTA